jgi:ABC-type transport system involved in cytochrome bd biosynthesis fused ATPase/permease subunit
MKEGRLVEHGNHRELLERNAHYAELYRMQFHPVPEAEMADALALA